MYMETFWGFSGVDWTGIYTLITLGLFVAAVLAARYTKRQWRIAQEHAEIAHRAQLEASRPYVIVTIEPSYANPTFFDLVVKNIGQRPALSVSITLDPPPKRGRETAGHEIANAKMLNEPIAMIAPGQEMRTFYDSHSERQGREDLPTSHQVSLKYRDSFHEEHSEANFLDIEAMKGTMFTDINTIHDIGSTLKKIQTRLANASLFNRSGTIHADATVEDRMEQQQRLAEETVEATRQHDDMLEQLGWARSAEAQSKPADASSSQQSQVTEDSAPPADS